MANKWALSPSASWDYLCVYREQHSLHCPLTFRKSPQIHSHHSRNHKRSLSLRRCKNPNTDITQEKNLPVAADVRRCVEFRQRLINWITGLYGIYLHQTPAAERFQDIMIEINHDCTQCTSLRIVRILMQSSFFTFCMVKARFLSELFFCMPCKRLLLSCLERVILLKGQFTQNGNSVIIFSSLHCSKIAFIL